MRLNSQTHHLETNLSAVTDFKIKASAQAFHILSSNLYSDPVLAVIRELICNAWDAHIRADKQDVPIRVHLPTAMDSEFRVKDEGTGISDHGMNNLFTTMFDSDKNESDEEIGGLGLGSKSPYALTDQYHLRSVFMGVARRYTAFKREDGKPGLATVGTPENVDEPDGFEVVVPVSPKHLHSFGGRYSRFIQTMPVKPVSNSLEETPSPDVLMAHDLGNGYRVEILKNGRHMKYEHDQPIIIMGIVPYTISGSQKYDLPDLFRNRGVIIRAPIGGFEVSPSREALSLKPEDYERLNQLAEQFSKAIRPYFADQINSAQNALELSTRHYELSSSPVFSRLYRQVIEVERLRWKGYDMLADIEGRCLLQVPHPNFTVNHTTLTRGRNGRGNPRLLRRNSPYNTWNKHDLKPAYIFYAEKNRPYRHMIDFDALSENDSIWVLSGDVAAIERWLRFYGLWSMARAITKPPRKVRDPSQPARRSFGSFEYEVRTINTHGRQLDREAVTEGRMTIAQIEAQANDEPVVVMAGRLPSILERLTKPGNKLLCVSVPTSHGKVAKHIDQNVATYATWAEYARNHCDLDAAVNAASISLTDRRIDNSITLQSAANRLRPWGRHSAARLGWLFLGGADRLIEPAHTLAQRARYFTEQVSQARNLEPYSKPAHHLWTQAWPDFDARVAANDRQWDFFMNCIERDIEKLRTTAPALFEELPDDIPIDLINAYLKETTNDQ